MRIIPGPPQGQPMALEHTPEVLSWDRKDSWPQQRLIPYQDELRRVIGPLVNGKTGLSVNLDVRLPAAALQSGRDLDNLLDPVVDALGSESFIAAWATKAQGRGSTVTVGTPRPIDADALGDWWHATARTESATEWKVRVAKQLAGRVALEGDGPVELIVAFTIGPGRAWRNLWKPAIDVLGGILGSAGREWHPRDDRIVRLGLTVEVDPGLGHAILVDYWWRHASPSLAEIGPAPRVVLGVDGFKGGWIGVVLRDGRFAGVSTASGLGELIDAHPQARVVGVDIPIGFAPSGGRAADDEARRRVGARSSSVFPTPPRAALDAATFAAANAIARGLTGKGLSQQSWALRARIVEGNALAAQDSRVIEVHPEVSFRQMHGTPLLWSKLAWNGQHQRRRLLSAQRVELPDELGAVGSSVPVADVLDAAAAAWTADRMLRGGASPLPDPPSADENGRFVAIWY